eukprot:6191711-Pleurochrysis_carterae.AAC.1
MDGLVTQYKDGHGNCTRRREDTGSREDTHTHSRRDKGKVGCRGQYRHTTQVARPIGGQGGKVGRREGKKREDAASASHMQGSRRQQKSEGFSNAETRHHHHATQRGGVNRRYAVANTRTKLMMRAGGKAITENRQRKKEISVAEVREREEPKKGERDKGEKGRPSDRQQAIQDSRGTKKEREGVETLYDRYIERRRGLTRSEELEKKQRNNEKQDTCDDNGTRERTTAHTEGCALKHTCASARPRMYAPVHVPQRSQRARLRATEHELGRCRPRDQQRVPWAHARIPKPAYIVARIHARAGANSHERPVPADENGCARDRTCSTQCGLEGHVRPGADSNA